MSITRINKKFDRESFTNDICAIINRFSEHGNKFTNAEIISCLTAIYTETLKQSVGKESGKYMMQRIIDMTFD